MNFFEHQDAARKSSGRMVFLFGLAVTVMILSLYVVTVLALSGGKRIHWFQPEIFLLVAIGTLIVISLGSLYKTSALKKGGSAVAQLFGGKLIGAQTTDLHERQLVNVVEEMAIASGVPVPQVYVIEEPGINAFAAGWSPDDAAVAVTRGCLNLLTREELQGVIAHEFSHVLNGDMRMNIRLMGLLHGILIIGIAGYFILRIGGRTRGRGALLVLVIGLALLIVGYSGLFFGRMIKASVSRQREFLADASAVQFTRNPAGIAGALKKIGGHVAGSSIQAGAAEEASHLFFGSAFAKKRFFSTHPALEDRIKRIDPSWDGKYTKVTAVADVAGAPAGAAGAAAGSGAAGVAANPAVVAAAVAAYHAPAPLPDAKRQIRARPEQIVAQVGAPTPGHVEYARQILAAIPEEVRNDAHEPFGAVALCYALLLDNDQNEVAKQLTILRQQTNAGLVQETLRMRELINTMDPRARLPALDLAMPALRQLAPEQYKAFRQIIHKLVWADSKVSLFEFSMEKVLEHRLDHAFVQPRTKSAQFHSFRPLLNDASLVLTALAYAGHHDQAEINKAWELGWKHVTQDRPSETSMYPKNMCTSENLDRALDRLELAAPGIKQRFIEAAAHTVLADGVITVSEAELLRAFAETLDVPIPPFIPSAG